MGKNRTLNMGSRNSAVAMMEHQSAPVAPEPSPAASLDDPSTSGRVSHHSGTSSSTRYLCYFVHRLLDFRIPELIALAEMYGVEGLQWEPPAGGHQVSPFWYVHLPSEHVAQQIVGRSVLIRCVLEIWGEGGTFEEMQEAVHALPEAFKSPYLDSQEPFRVVLDSWGFKWSNTEQKQLLGQLAAFLPFQGPVSLTAARHSFWLCCISRKQGNNGLPDELPTRWVFGRQVALADRSWVDTFALPKRAYIGPTSMDPEVAFLMTNMAQVRPHSLVLDPYVGTGSILIAAAARGAYTIGTDIDIRVIKRGKVDPSTGKQLDIYSNYQQYGLQSPVGLLRMDVHTHPFRRGLAEVFDAVLGDPPYGVRAGGRKSVAKDVTVTNRESYIPSTEPYSLTECLADLLELAAALLKVGGRLVFFLPATPDTYREDQLPSHPMLQLVDNTEQFLTTRYSRRLVTMVKVKPYDAAAVAHFNAARAGFVMAIDQLHDIVYAQEDRKRGLKAACQDQAADGVSTDVMQEGQQQQQQQLQPPVVTRAAKPRFRSKMT